VKNKTVVATLVSSRAALWSARPVIGGSGGAQRCDAVNAVKSGESGEENLCTEARRWAVRVSVVKEHLWAALSRKPMCMTAILC